jgi:preprotein translocase subunit SecG
LEDYGRAPRLLVSALTNVTEWLSTFFLLYVLLFSTWRHSSIN